MLQFVHSAVLVIASATAPLPASPADPLAACKSPSSTYEEVVRVCSAVIDDAKASTDQKYTALLYRAYREFSEASNYTRGMADLAAAIKLKPDDANAYVVRGQRHNSYFEYKEAAADFTTALRLRPGLKEALVNRAYAYLELKNPDGAISDYDEILRSSPDDAETLANRGTAYENKGDIDRARADYNRAISLKRELAGDFPARCFSVSLPWEKPAPLQLVNWPACQAE